jgi:transcriptional regulator with XRE-family HTH domain
MATPPKKTKDTSAHLYIREWREHLQLSDEEAGDRTGVSRTTFWRWETEQQRLNPEKIAKIAKAFGIHPAQLWQSPQSKRVSLDAVVEGTSDELYATALDVVRRIVGRR